MDEFDQMPPQQSYLQWYINSIGLPTLTLIVLATLLAMILVVVLFLRGRGPAVPAAILFLMPLPLIVGLIALIAGSISYFNEVAMSEAGPVAPDAMSYAVTSAIQASSCFCPLLMLSLTLLMVLGFRDGKTRS